MDSNSSNEEMNSAGSPTASKNEMKEINNFDEKMQAAADVRIVLPGDYIGEGFISGHGTFENQKDNKIYSNMAGVVHQIDQVVCVRPLRQGYRPDIGDVIVGKIVQTDQKRWMVDANSYQHAILNLTSINLPGGV
jgi:exosome complex component RRP4